METKDVHEPNIPNINEQIINRESKEETDEQNNHQPSEGKNEGNNTDDSSMEQKCPSTIEELWERMQTERIALEATLKTESQKRIALETTLNTESQKRIDLETIVETLKTESQKRIAQETIIETLKKDISQIKKKVNALESLIIKNNINVD